MGRNTNKAKKMELYTEFGGEELFDMLDDDKKERLIKSAGIVDLGTSPNISIMFEEIRSDYDRFYR